MGRLFGTDGVRGVANQELTAELALALGAAAARRLAELHAMHRQASRRRTRVGLDRHPAGRQRLDGQAEVALHPAPGADQPGGGAQRRRQ